MHGLVSPCNIGKAFPLFISLIAGHSDPPPLDSGLVGCLDDLLSRVRFRFVYRKFVKFWSDNPLLKLYNF